MAPAYGVDEYAHPGGHLDGLDGSSESCGDECTMVSAVGRGHQGAGTFFSLGTSAWGRRASCKSAFRKDLRWKYVNWDDSTGDESVLIY